jgi:hypothetical protein
MLICAVYVSNRTVKENLKLLYKFVLLRYCWSYVEETRTDRPNRSRGFVALFLLRMQMMLNKITCRISRIIVSKKTKELVYTDIAKIVISRWPARPADVTMWAFIMCCTVTISPPNVHHYTSEFCLNPHLIFNELSSHGPMYIYILVRHAISWESSACRDTLGDHDQYAAWNRLTC